MTILPRPLPKVLGLAMAVTSLMAGFRESEPVLPEDAVRKSPVPVPSRKGSVLRRPRWWDDRLEDVRTRGSRPKGADERDMHAAVVKRTRKALKRLRDEARSKGGRIEPLEVIYTEFVNGELNLRES